MGKRPKWRKLYNVLCVLKALAYTNVATCQETNMFEVWVSYSGRMGSSHLCGKKMVPQSASSFKRAWNKTEMYPPSISVNMEVKCFPLPEYHSSVHTPKLWNVETFSEAVSILEKVPIMPPVYAHGGLLSISSEFSSAQRQQENRGTAWTGNICHTAPRFLHGQERARSWKKPSWYLHVAQNHNCWTVDKMKAAGWKWQAQEPTLRVSQADWLHCFYSLKCLFFSLL